MYAVCDQPEVMVHGKIPHCDLYTDLYVMTANVRTNKRTLGKKKWNLSRIDSGTVK